MGTGLEKAELGQRHGLDLDFAGEIQQEKELCVYAQTAKKGNDMGGENSSPQRRQQDGAGRADKQHQGETAAPAPHFSLPEMGLVRIRTMGILSRSCLPASVSPIVPLTAPQ